MAETPRHAVKVPPAVAHSYRAAAIARGGVRVSDLLIEELRAAYQAVKAGRGDSLPPASKPGRRKTGEQPAGPLEQLKWPMDDAEYRSIRDALESAGSSPTAVLRSPQHVRVTPMSR